MTNYPHILFDKTPLQLRLIGARGGRAFGRNQRARRARIGVMTTPAVALCAAPAQTTAEAIAELDEKFPWLRCPENMHSGKHSFVRLTRVSLALRKPPKQKAAKVSSVGPGQ